MKKLLNTLYVTTPGTYLSKEGMTLAVQRDGATVMHLPLLNLSGIVCFGRVSCSPYLMNYCAEQEVLISFLDENGRFLARVEGPVSGNVLLRREQYRAADSPERSMQCAALLLAGKLANQRAVLRRFVRDHKPNDNRVAEAAEAIGEFIGKLPEAGDLDTLRGWEGKAADYYFDVFQTLICDPATPFQFNGRSRRPPLDMVNALLSFAYTLATHEVIAGLESVGLDPAVGFLHRDRPGRQSLALDLVEELRPCLCDRLVLSLINNRRVTPRDFRTLENGAVYLNDDGRKTFLQAWQQRKQETLEHPYLKEKIETGLLFFVQARLLAKYLRGEMDYYLPYVWK